MEDESGEPSNKVRFSDEVEHQDAAEDSSKPGENASAKAQGDINQNTTTESGCTQDKLQKPNEQESKVSVKETEWKKHSEEVGKIGDHSKDDLEEDESKINEKMGIDDKGMVNEDPQTDVHVVHSLISSDSDIDQGKEQFETPIAESGVKSLTGNLKRSKHKSHSSAERKKRKKASKSKESATDSGIQSTSEAGTSQRAQNTKTEAENAVLEKSDSDSSSDSESSSKTSSLSSSSSESSVDEVKENPVLTDDEVWLEKHTDEINLPSWQAVQQLRRREYGCNNPTWQSRVCGSNAMVRRFEQQHALDAHEGCVNALHFNQTGTLLVSGSDDLDIHIWDWVSASQEPYISYNSGHRSNVFQAKFMPNSNDLTVISCARDGQVRVGYLSSTGTCRDTKKIAQHRGSAHKLALDSAGCRSTFLSCGEDSVVMGFDLRENKPATKLMSVKSGDKKVALYSIDTSPHQPQLFAVSGRDQWARVYDRRMLDHDNPETVTKYCPHHLQNATDMKANITCLVYNYDGSEMLCSYNDEDIYLFNMNHSDEADFERKYKGHRNNATVKGVNFYGPNSEFVISGSDCGNVFLWDKASSKVVQFMQGDDGGVVNVLEPHPNLPLIATSGLDKNIKIWGPTGDGILNEEKLKKLMLTNRQERHDESNDSHVIDSHLLWFLMRSLRNARTRMRTEGDEDDDSSDSSSSNSSESDGDEEPETRRRMDCLTS